MCSVAVKEELQEEKKRRKKIKELSIIIMIHILANLSLSRTRLYKDKGEKEEKIDAKNNKNDFLF